MTENTTQEEKKTPSQKLRQIGQKIQHGFEHVHKKIGIYGWASIGLLLLLIATIAHYEGRDFRRYHRGYESHPLYIHQNNNWRRSIDRDFQTMQRQMDSMHARSEAMMRNAWNVPLDGKVATTSIVSSGDFQYSMNTKNGKLDGFVATSPENIQELLSKIQKLGLTVDQKDNKIFFSGDAKITNELIQLLK